MYSRHIIFIIQRLIISTKKHLKIAIAENNKEHNFTTDTILFI